VIIQYYYTDEMTKFVTKLLFRYKSDETVNFCGFRSATPSPITVFINFVFTALHLMQTRYSDENSVCPSVCLSVTRVIPDKTEERSCQGHRQLFFFLFGAGPNVLTEMRSQSRKTRLRRHD